MLSSYRKKINNRKPIPFISKTIIPAYLFLLLLSPTQLLAQDITAPNTEQTTIQQAIDAISGTGIITILRGNYTENLIVKSNITLQGEETAQVIITSPDSAPAMDLTGISNVTIRNLSITSSSIGVQITNSTNISIHNNVFALGTNAAPTGTAIDLLDTTSSVTIEQNTFFANNLAINKKEDSVIKYNIFFNNDTAFETNFGNSNTDLNCFDISTGTGIGTNITEIDPAPPQNDLMFANQSLNDFHLQQGSPCIDTITTFNDAIDTTNADMGAYGGPDMDLIPFPPQTITVTVDSVAVPHTVNIRWDDNLSYLITNTISAGGYQVHYDTVQPDSNNPVYNGNEAGDPLLPVLSPITIDAPDNTLLLEFQPDSLELTPEQPVVSIAPSSQTLDLSWPAVVNASSYTVHYGINAITDNTEPDITDTSFSITGLINNETYQVAVSAIHQPQIFIAVTTFDNSNADPNNANISEFSIKDGQNIGDPVPRQSDIVTAIPELIEPFPNLPGEGCFIATAAWGYYSAPQVKLLRDFRDQYLLTNKAGRLFVQWYYTHGPDAAQYLNANPHFKSLVRAILYPLIVFSQFMINTSLLMKSLITAFILFITILFATILRIRVDDKKCV